MTGDVEDCLDSGAQVRAGGPVGRAGDPPAEAVAGLGSFLDRLRQYADLLADEGVLRGLIGPREVPRLWERHLLNSLAAVQLVPPGSSVIDLGSGAGLPGVVWALARPDLQVELVEPMLRRVTWLDEVVERLGLVGVRVTRARAEDLRGQRSVDVVAARAVAPLDRLAGWALPLLRAGGELLALKGASAAEELERARPTLARLGTRSATVLHPGAPGVSQPTTVVQVVTGSGPAAEDHRGPRAGARRRRR